MVIQYKIKFEGDGVTITQSVNPATDRGGGGPGVNPDDGGGGPGVNPDDGGGGPGVNPDDGGGGPGVNPDDGGGGPGVNPDDGGGGRGRVLAVVLGPLVIGEAGLARAGANRQRESVRNPAVAPRGAIRPRPKTVPSEKPFGSSGSINLDFPMHCQRQKNWCWAAVTAGVKEYPLTPAPQCEVATAALPGGQDCCVAPGPCDIEFSLKTALRGEGKLFEFRNEQITFPDLQQEIDLNKPVCARIVWDDDGDGFGEGAHFVVIVGYQNPGPGGVPWVSVKDPDGGAAGLAAEIEANTYDLPFEDFRSRYRLIGTWLQTYRVK